MGQTMKNWKPKRRTRRKLLAGLAGGAAAVAPIVASTPTVNAELIEYTAEMH